MLFCWMFGHTARRTRVRIDLVEKVERMRVRTNVALVEIVTDGHRVNRLCSRETNIEHVGTKELGHITENDSLARLSLAVVISKCMSRLDRKCIQMNLPLVLEFGFGWIDWEQPRVIKSPVVKGNDGSETIRPLDNGEPASNVRQVCPAIVSLCNILNIVESNRAIPHGPYLEQSHHRGQIGMMFNWTRAKVVGLFELADLLERPWLRTDDEYLAPLVLYISIVEFKGRFRRRFVHGRILLPWSI
jgi:hypothetical protein